MTKPICYNVSTEQLISHVNELYVYTKLSNVYEGYEKNT